MIPLGVLAAATPRGVVPPPATDPYWASVVSLLHFDGADGSTTFTDEKGKVWTPSGNAQIDTAQSKFGGASGLFDGSGDYISTPSHADFGFGSGDYTVECWLWPSTSSGDRCYFDNRESGVEGIGLYVLSGNAFGVANNSAIIATTATGYLGIGSKNHLAVARQSSTLRGFVNGVQAFSVADARTMASAAPARIAATYLATTGFPGGVDDFRVTKGIARYTANFTPPTAAFPNS